jgi:GNAT superfamily N-acetyltransferase
MVLEFKRIDDKQVPLFDKDWEELNEEVGMPYRRDRYSFGIFLDGKAVGYFDLKIAGGRCYVHEIIIRKEFRREGLGKEAFVWIEDFAMKRGCHKVSLKTTGKYMIIGLAKKLGYKEEAVLKDDAFHMDWIFLSKHL